MQKNFLFFYHKVIFLQQFFFVSKNTLPTAQSRLRLIFCDLVVRPNYFLTQSIDKISREGKEV